MKTRLAIEGAKAFTPMMVRTIMEQPEDKIRAVLMAARAELDYILTGEGPANQ